MTPLKIEFDVSRFIPPDSGGIHLDGLLAAMHVQRKLVAGAPAGGNIRDLQAGMDEFLSFETFNGVAVPQASMIMFDARHLGQVVMTRKTDVDNLCRSIAGNNDYFVTPGRMNNLDLNSGQYRNWMYFMPVAETAQGHAVAWCIGDHDKIQSLLSDVHHIGRKGSLGYGRITGVSVSAVPPDECHWQQRNLPAGHPAGSNHATGYGGLQAPYWDRALHTEILIPNLFS